ncbi:MAG: hypothetical protein Sapg2KO_14290 [Saprospiraceae bacterium]
MNEKMSDIMKLARVELIIIPIFVLLKYVRPSVLKSEAPEFLKITLLSFPNFFEAIIGTLSLTIIILFFNNLLNRKYQIGLKILYLIAVVLAGIYVIAQEFNIINIRSNTTFDRNDVIFSIIGLITAYVIVLLIKPRIYNE